VDIVMALEDYFPFNKIKERSPVVIMLDEREKPIHYLSILTPEGILVRSNTLTVPEAFDQAQKLQRVLTERGYEVINKVSLEPSS
jgi:hypothetical protein